MAVSPTTVPVQWSTKKCDPICAPGCKSMPERKCAHSVMMRGISATFFRYKLVRQPLHRDGLDERIRHHALPPCSSPPGRRRRPPPCPSATSRAGAAGCPRNSSVRLCAAAVMFFFGKSGGRIVFEALADFVLQLAEHGIQQCRRHHLDFRGMNQLLVEETGEQQRAANPCVMAVMARLDGRFLPSRWLMPPTRAYDATSSFVSLVTVSTGKDLPQRNEETKILSVTAGRAGRPGSAGVPAASCVGVHALACPPGTS